MPDREVGGAMEDDERESQGEFPEKLGEHPKHAATGQYTGSEIPGEAEPTPSGAEGQYTDSVIPGDPEPTGKTTEGQFTDSELAAEPDAAGRDEPGTYTEKDQ
jgi:hypothetical protein